MTLISRASKDMLKILQNRLRQYADRELPDEQARFRKGRGTRDQIANIRWIMEKEREFQKDVYLCFIDYTKAFDCGDHNKLWEVLRHMGIPDHFISLIQNLYSEQEPLKEPCVEKLNVSTSRKVYDKAAYCHLTCSIYMQSTL